MVYYLKIIYVIGTVKMVLKLPLYTRCSSIKSSSVIKRYTIVSTRPELLQLLRLTTKKQRL